MAGYNKKLLKKAIQNYRKNGEVSEKYTHVLETYKTYNLTIFRNMLLSECYDLDPSHMSISEDVVCKDPSNPSPEELYVLTMKRLHFILKGECSPVSYDDSFNFQSELIIARTNMLSYERGVGPKSERFNPFRRIIIKTKNHIMEGIIFEAFTYTLADELAKLGMSIKGEKTYFVGAALRYDNIGPKSAYKC